MSIVIMQFQNNIIKIQYILRENTVKQYSLILLLILVISGCGQKRYDIGSVAYIPQVKNEVVIDCDMTLDEALANVPEDCPREIIDNLALVEVFYYGFDHKIHRGQLLMDYRLADDAHSIFASMLDARFPLYGAVPIDHSSHTWDDYENLPEGNTYSFHYRKIVFKNELSYHAYGQAIDINPVLNPFRKWGRTFPPNGTYNPEEAGTLFEGHTVVQSFRRQGWKWGGDWRRRDYQHFQKPIKGAADTHIAKNPGVIYWPKGLKRDLSGNRYLSYNK